MIGAPLLLLVGITGPFQTDGELVAQMAQPVRPVPASTGTTQIINKGVRRPRAVRRARRNDITETLRAMSLMNAGMQPSTEQRAAPNQ
jgi:hypothetical protein